MSGQRSSWRERLHANPSRMEEELAIRLQDDQIRYPIQVRNTSIVRFCVARPARIPIFSRCSIASRILTGTHQQPRSHPIKRHADFIIDLDSQAFSRRFPWHPQDPQPFQPLALERLSSDSPFLQLASTDRIFHPPPENLLISLHSLKTHTPQDLILLPDQLARQPGPLRPLSTRSVLRPCGLMRRLDQVLDRLNHLLPLRLPPNPDTPLLRSILM